MQSKYQAISFSQNNQGYISLVLPLSVIDNISQVLVYGDHPDGYQRKPNKVHYNKIKKAISQNRYNFKLPTSIVLGADEEYVNTILTNEGQNTFLNFEAGEKHFRVVDGQHRICGLKEAARTDPTINDFLLPVIIVLAKPGKRSIELEIFSDINSKGKRISTDLAELAKHDYQIKEETIKVEEINKHIGIKTAFHLKSQNDSNVWQNAINFDIHSDVTLGLVGVTLFTESIKNIIDTYFVTHSYIKEDNTILQGQDLIQYCADASEEVGHFLYKVWNEIVKIKWKNAFKEDIVKNDEGSLVKIFYSKEYYIQKGIGVKSINSIIGDIVIRNGIDNSSFNEIKKVLFESKVQIEHWKIGGPFSGFNSESGFNKVKKMILNEHSVLSAT